MTGHTPDSDHWSTRARGQGRAARRGARPLAAPYPSASTLARLWEEGWLLEDHVLRTGEEKVS